MGLLLWASTRLKSATLIERVLRRNPLYYSAAKRRIAHFASCAPAELRRLLRERLATVLATAAGTKHGAGVADPLDLASWPLIDKAQVRADPRAFRVSAGWTAAHASTSGTTGAPLVLLRSGDAVAHEQACLDGLVGRLGADPGTARMAVLRGELLDAQGRRHFRTCGRRLTLSSYHLCRATFDAYADALERFRPDVLWAYPSALESLCRLAAGRGRRLTIPRVLCSSEVLGTGAWNTAREVLGCEMADHYGQSERVAFAYATTPSEYRFLPGYSVVELLPCGSDDTHDVYEIVGTSLWNLAMPLVRYRTGDLVRVPRSTDAAALEEIALGLRPFAGVVGRDADVLLLPEGARLTTINHIPRDVTRIAALQIVQESVEHVCIRVVPGPRYDADGARDFLERARTALPVTMRVSLEPTESLEKGRLGKTPVIVHRPAVREALLAARRELNRAAQMLPPRASPEDAARAGAPAQR
jgi:phenylacetate-CoA ligase